MFKPNQVFGGTYVMQQEIGHGGTSAVYLAYHQRLQKYVVIKRIFSNFTGSLANRTEVDILKNLHHPYLPQVYDFLQINREVYTVMDYIEGRGLDALLETPHFYPEKTLSHWLRQMLEVLDYLHTQRRPIIHSDIKPGNIILTKRGDLCLIDFNISLDGSGAGKISGYSQFYAAPEQVRLAGAKLRGQPCNIALDARTDLYSLAATFYTLASGRVPLSNRPSPPLRQLMANRYSAEFLAILDHAMAWNPAQRYPSAKKMMAALDRLKRQDSRYRAYVALQAVSWLGSAVLLGAGLFCIVRGMNVRGQETYRSIYNSMVQQVQAGNDAKVEQYGTELLDDTALHRILEQTPQNHGAVLYALGDCCYNRAEYDAAADYYNRALQAAPANDPQRGAYYCDCAIAYVRAGNTAAAGRILEKAKQAGLESTRLLLIQAAVSKGTNDNAACLDAVQQLLAAGAAPELCAQGCLFAADACGSDTSARIAWLEAAAGYNQSLDVLRRLGAAYMELAATAKREEAKRYASAALQAYQTICQADYPALEDELNYAIVQRVMGDSTASIQTLNRLRQAYPDDYRISMNLAFAYKDAGDDRNAATCCSLALRLWNETPATDREDENTESIKNLLELQKQLGV